MKRIIYPILLLAVLMSCQQKGQRQYKTGLENVTDTTRIELTIDPQKIPAVPFDSLMDEVKFVRLESNEKCLIGVISQFICTDKFIFVMDDESAMGVFCFDMQGNFIRKIGQVGQGPGEYVRLCNIALSADKKHLIVVDWANNLLYYDFNGNLTKTVHLGAEISSFNAIEEIDEQLIAGFYDKGCGDGTPPPMLFAAHSNDQKIKYRALPTYQTPLFTTIDERFPFRKFGDELYLRAPWTESFYKVGADGCTEVYRLTLTNGGYPEITDDINRDTYMELLNKTITVDEFVFCKDAAIFFFFVPKSQAYYKPCVIYYPKTNSMLQCSGQYTNPLFEFYSPFNTPLVRQGDNTYVVQQSASRVMATKNKIYDSPLIQDETLEKLYDGLTEDDNPVLFFYHLRH